MLVSSHEPGKRMILDAWKERIWRIATCIRQHVYTCCLMHVANSLHVHCSPFQTLMLQFHYIPPDSNSDYLATQFLPTDQPHFGKTNDSSGALYTSHASRSGIPGRDSNIYLCISKPGLALGFETAETLMTTSFTKMTPCLLHVATC